MMKRKRNLIACCLFLPLISMAASPSPYFNPLITLSLGTSNIEAGQSNTLPVIDYATYAYAAHDRRQTPVLFGAFLGNEFQLSSHFAAQLGLAYYQPGNYRAEGILTQGIDPATSQQYPYHYKTITRQLLLESKWLYTLHERFHPYAEVGLGTAWNTAYRYNISYPADVVSTPFFANKSSSGFSYNAGLGLDVDVIKHLRFGLGYRFTDFGASNLGQANILGTPVSGTLKRHHLYTNEGLLQLTYLFY